MREKITILGAGATGLAAAADLTLAGCRVTLYEQPEFARNLKIIADRGGITLTGAARTGTAKIDRITTDIGEAVHNSEVLLVAVVAGRHEEVARLCVPFLKEGQTIVISPGNAGSLVFANTLKKQKAPKNIRVSDLEGNLYPCRITKPAEVVIALPFKPKHIAAFPARETTTVMDALAPFYATKPATNVLEASLNSPNVVIHLAASLLNVGAIEQAGGQYYLFKSGLTPSVLDCVEMVHAEKAEVFRVLGYTDRSPLDHLRKVANQSGYPELDLFRGLIGPTSVTHRYITEDASTGLSLLISLGEMIDVPVTITKALVNVASAINRVDYFHDGRSIKNLGVPNMSAAQLNRFLEDGTI